MVELSTAQAARNLGVSQRQVQRMVRRGALPGRTTAGGAKLVDALAVTQTARQRACRGRPWSPATAWAALIGPRDADWLNQATRKRLERRLEEAPVEELVIKLTVKAQRKAYRAGASFLDDVLAELVPTGVSALDEVDTELTPSRDRVEGYLHPDRLDDVVRRYHLVEDPNGNVVLHLTDFESVLRGKHVPAQVIGADLAVSFEARERAAGLELVHRWLKR